MNYLVWYGAKAYGSRRWINPPCHHPGRSPGCETEILGGRIQPPYDEEHERFLSVLQCASNICIDTIFPLWYIPIVWLCPTLIFP